MTMTLKGEELIARYIVLDSQFPWPDEAYVRDYGVSVWAIIGDLEIYKGDIDRVAAAYEIPREAVEAAIAYYWRHKTLIDARIQANRTAPAA